MIQGVSDTLHGLKSDADALRKAAAAFETSMKRSYEL